MSRRFYSLTSLTVLAAFILAPWNTPLSAADRDTKVRNDLKKVSADKRWIYNDLETGINLARLQKKPLLVVFRCIP